MECRKDQFQDRCYSAYFSLICFLLVEKADVTSYADDNTSFVCSENIDATQENLEDMGQMLSE